MNLSFCVTSFNRFELTIECVRQVISHPRVEEIVLSDDCSTDDSYEKLVEHFKYQNKVKVFRNRENIDCYRNKMVSISLATQPWCVLADSDNQFGLDFINKIIEQEPWEPDTIYAPDYAMPFDYRAYGGMTFDKHNVAQYMSKHYFSTAMNTANYFVNREQYLKCWDGSVDPVTADTIFHNYNHLKSGGKIKIVEGLQYKHLIHDQSHFKTQNRRTGNFYAIVELALKEMK